MSYDAFKEFCRTRRAEKMRLYNRKSRKKAKLALKPTAREVYAQAFGMLADNAREKRNEMMFHIVGRLTEQGFDESESWMVVERMVCGPTNVDTSSQVHEFVDC